MTDRASDGAEGAFGRRVVAEARSWIGTPYQHQASCRGAGADCLGLVRGIWREVLGHEPEPVPAYTPDWSEADGRERILEAAGRHFRPVAVDEARKGDVLVMRMMEAKPAKHMGILARAPAGYTTLIHAYSGHGVVESPLTPAWQRRVVAAFRFPGSP